jgi:hypothetical protein
MVEANAISGDAMRLAALIGLTALLTGCCVVTSTVPLFSRDDIRGQAQLRSGVWIEEKQGCAVDTAQPVVSWAGCADVWVVRPNEILAGRDPGARSSWLSS